MFRLTPQEPRVNFPRAAAIFEVAVNVGFKKGDLRDLPDQPPSIN